MWARASRGLFERKGARTSSDLSDGERVPIAPPIPLSGRGGRQHEVEVREVMTGARYVLEISCPWRASPSAGAIYSQRAKGTGEIGAADRLAGQ